MFTQTFSNNLYRTGTKGHNNTNVCDFDEIKCKKFADEL